MKEIKMKNRNADTSRIERAHRKPTIFYIGLGERAMRVDGCALMYSRPLLILIQFKWLKHF